MDNGMGDEEDLDLSVDHQTFDEHIDVARSSASNSTQSTTPARTSLGRRLQTADGEMLTSCSYGDEYTRFFIPQTRPTAVDGAYFSNILAVPALDCYANTPPPSEKVGKYVKYPEYHALEKRLESFSTYFWPFEKPSEGTLAKADMFYLGSFEEKGDEIADQVVCYKCGQTFRQWEEHDNPVDEHKKIYPQCFMEKWIINMYEQ